MFVLWTYNHAISFISKQKNRSFRIELPYAISFCLCPLCAQCSLCMTTIRFWAKKHVIHFLLRGNDASLVLEFQWLLVAPLIRSITRIALLTNFRYKCEHFLLILFLPHSRKIRISVRIVMYFLSFSMDWTVNNSSADKIRDGTNWQWFPTFWLWPKNESYHDNAMTCLTPAWRRNKFWRN